MTSNTYEHLKKTCLGAGILNPNTINSILVPQPRSFDPETETAEIFFEIRPEYGRDGSTLHPGLVGIVMDNAMGYFSGSFFEGMNVTVSMTLSHIKEVPLTGCLMVRATRTGHEGRYNYMRAALYDAKNPAYLLAEAIGVYFELSIPRSEIIGKCMKAQNRNAEGLDDLDNLPEDVLTGTDNQPKAVAPIPESHIMEDFTPHEESFDHETGICEMSFALTKEHDNPMRLALHGGLSFMLMENAMACMTEKYIGKPAKCLTETVSYLRSVPVTEPLFVRVFMEKPGREINYLRAEAYDRSNPEKLLLTATGVCIPE